MARGWSGELTDREWAHTYSRCFLLQDERQEKGRGAFLVTKDRVKRYGYVSEGASFLRSSAEMPKKIYWSRGKSFSTINSSKTSLLRLSRVAVSLTEGE